MWGTNATGKIGNYTLGIISSRTGSWDYFGLQKETTSRETAGFTVLRAKRDLFEKSSVGILYAGKEIAEENRRVIGLDTSIASGENFILTGQIAQSWNTGDEPFPRAYLLTLTRGADLFNAEISMERIEAEFSVNQTGFIQKEAHRGWQRVGTQLEYTPRLAVLGHEKLVIGTGSYLSQGLYTNKYFSDWKHQHPGLQMNPQFDADLLLWSNSVWSRVKFRELFLERIDFIFNYAREAELTEVFWAKEAQMMFRTDTAKRFFTTFQVGMGNFYNFSQKYIGNQRSLDIQGTLRPKDNLTLELVLAIAQTSTPAGEIDGEFISNSVRVTYLLTKDLFFRLSTQTFWGQTYYSETETDLRYLISGLIGWEYSPKSHFFLAYNESRDTLARQLRLKNRVIVAKVSYLWDL